jgi:hypothetical protein
MTSGLAGSFINFIKAKANCFGLYVFLVDSIARDAVDIGGGLATFSTTETPFIWRN